MFAYTKNNHIEFISATLLDDEFLATLENHEDFEVLEYPDEIQNPIFENGKIVEAPKIESEWEKYARVFSILANPENALTTKALEGLHFTDEQIGDLIQARVFGGNPHAQMALLAKIQAMTLSGTPNPWLIAEATATQAGINAVREFFKLSDI